MKLGEHLKKYMRKRNITEEQLEAMGVANITSILSGEDEPTVKDMQLLAAVLDIPKKKLNEVFFPDFHVF